MSSERPITVLIPERPAPVLFGLLSLAAIVPALIEHGGGRLGEGTLLAVRVLNFIFVGIFAFEVLLGYLMAENRRQHLRNEAFEFVLLAGLALAFLLAAVHPFGFFAITGLKGWVIPAQMYLALNLLLELLRLYKLAARTHFNYARAFGISFLVIIAVGTLLLWLLPGAKAPGKELGFVDALFTATSATCVTGLVTVDTGTHYSTFGQTVILFLFQVGGLGLMTFAAFFAVALGKGMGIRDREVMKGVLNLEVMGNTFRVVVGILVLTAVMEGIGVVALYSQWHGELAPHDRLFTSVFHSASAFCNAGFSLQADSLEGYRDNASLNFVIMLQIVIGGLGFAVLLELLGRPVLGIRRRKQARSDGPSARRARLPRLSVQTRIVLVSSVVLIFGGAMVLYGLEANNPATLGSLERGDRAQAALFQSVTARTAGFNTVPIGEMTDAGQFFLSLLMLIGASPGSTGGGIKTVTTVVLILTVIALLRGRSRVEAFGRTLPKETVSRAIVIVVFAIVIVTGATLVLVAAEAGRFPFLSVFFEVSSGFGTVGLSTGITGSLTTVSKLTLCLVMLVGRIGPISLVIALSQAKVRRRYDYPEEHVMIG